MGLQERKLREFSRREHEILAASIRLFDADDWQSVTVEEIADLAEVGKGTVYKHFSSKEDIYSRLTLDFYEALLEELARVDLNQPADAVFKQSFEVALWYHYKNPAYRRVTQYCKRGDFKKRISTDLLQQFRDCDEKFKGKALEMLKVCVETGVIPNGPYQQMLYGITTTFEGAVNILWNGECLGDGLVVEDYIHAISAFIMSGLKGSGFEQGNP